MNRYLNWYGRIALLNTETGDGRTLTGMTDERLPVPVLYRPRPRPGFSPHVAPQTVGMVTRLRDYGGRAVWANLRLNLDLLPQHPEGSLYPEVDVELGTSSASSNLHGALSAVWLGTAPCWPQLAPVIEVVPDE